jgi:endoglucanase
MNILDMSAQESDFKQNENPKSVVDLLGMLHVKENKIVDKNDNPVALHGMSLFWSQWGGKFYNEKCIDWLYNDFHCTVVRAAMGIEGGGYLTDPETETAKVFEVIEECTKLGIYVIVDWHDHHAEAHLEQAKRFFNFISEKYSDQPNIIYEIYNEPLKVSWTEIVKPYAEEVIKVIRKNDPDNLIIVGTPTWSQNVDDASKNMINDNNTAYAIHFYTSTHKKELRDKATEAMKNGAALFVSEYGTSEANGNGIIDSLETATWFAFLKENNLSTCNWSVMDKKETSAALIPGADFNGNWEDSDLSVSGKFNRDYIREENFHIFDALRLEK